MSKITLDKTEYDRLNEEMKTRIKTIYGDGALVSSILLVYFISAVGALLNLYKTVFKYNNNTTLILCAALCIVIFVFPVFLCYTFATKSSENLASIINIATFIKTYHESFTIADNDTVSGKMWEKAHKNAMIPSVGREIKEYFILALLSVTVFAVFSVADIVCIFVYIDIALKWLEITVFVIVNLFFICLGGVITYKTKKMTDLQFVLREITSCTAFYKRQKTKLEQSNINDFDNKIQTTTYEDVAFNLFVIRHKIPFYKTEELEKAFYCGAPSNIEDKIYKKIRKMGDTQNIKDFILANNKKKKKCFRRK